MHIFQKKIMTFLELGIFFLYHQNILMYKFELMRATEIEWVVFENFVNNQK